MCWFVANMHADRTATVFVEKDGRMSGTIKMNLALAAVLTIAAPVWSQEPDSNLDEKAQETLESARETAGAVAESVDTNEQAQEVSAGILKPIYRLAEAFSFPAFHWIAFAVMVAGVVSFALQLTLGKLVVLARLGFSVAAILSDVLGLAVSLVGLVLTTQAAAENSNFTTSAAAVLSAAAVGAIAGLVFYVWGQRQELQAVEGRKRAATENTGEKGK
jgi:ABC-type multidrug transport system fused ATPase/permease subunit